MSFSSTIQILKVNEIEKGISKKTGAAWERHTAECMLLSDVGEIECVGKLTIPVALREGLKTGTYRAGFALHVPTFGDRKGEVSTQLVSLSAVPVRAPVAGAVKPA